MIKVLFVCLGNICRSPTAHAVFTGLVKARGLEDRILVDSAGTSDWHIGKAPDPRSIATALERGVDLSQLRGSQVRSEDFQVYDYILAMDQQNLVDLQALQPADFAGRLDLFMRFAPEMGVEEVPDPYYGGQEGFVHVVDLIGAASAGLLQHIIEQDGQ